MTQQRIILSHVLNLGSISPMEAFNKHGITRLAAGVFELRKKGVVIVKTMEKSGKMRPYARYSIGRGHIGPARKLLRTL